MSEIRILHEGGDESESPEKLALEMRLRSMTDAELFVYEDELFLRHELTGDFKIRVSAGRWIIMVLGMIYWGVGFLAVGYWIESNFGRRDLGILWLIPFVGSLVAAAIFAGFTWKAIGRTGRFIVRTALHYWPVLAMLFGVALYIFKAPKPT